MTDILIADASRADEVRELIHTAFRDRPTLDPPGTALEETTASVAATLTEHGGLLAVIDGAPVGSLLFADLGDLLGVRRVGVLGWARRHGVAGMLAERAAEIAVQRGKRGLVLEARAELPTTVGFWQHHGYVASGRDGNRLTMLRLLPITITLPDAADTTELGRRLAKQLGKGDLVLLSGDLGSGKTTFTQGIGAGLGVRGPITSPTYVIARIHPHPGGGPALVHVDAYRLGDSAELDDLDLDTDLDEAVTVVEWGAGLAESLSSERLELCLERAEDDVRTLTLTPVGRRWLAADLAGLLA